MIGNLKDLITLMNDMNCSPEEILVQKKKLMRAPASLDTVDLTADSDLEDVELYFLVTSSI